MFSPSGTSTPVFVSYSHRDKKWLGRLQIHLKPLVRTGNIDLWDDTRIQPGANWKAEIDRALVSARVAVLMISADFLASDFIQDQELPILLEAAEQRGTRILPVILSHSLFADSPLGRFQAINAPDKPLAELTEAQQDKVLRDLAQAISARLSGAAGADEPMGTATQPPTAREQVMQTKGPDRAPAQSGQVSSEKEPSGLHSRGAWISGGLLLAFMLAVFTFAPPQLPEQKHRILALCAALVAGLFGWFLGGEIGLRVDALKSRFGDLRVRAGGGLALFVLVLVWWLSPLAPIEVGETRNGGGASDPAIPMQGLAGSIRAAKTGKPIAGAQVIITDYDTSTTTDHLGRFSFQLSVPAGTTVELVVASAGFVTYSEYVAAGTAGLGIKMERSLP